MTHRFVAILVMGTALAAGAAPAAQPGDAPSTFDAEVTITPWVEFWTTYDLSRLGDLFWESPDVTYLSSERQELIRGFEAVRSHHEGLGFVNGERTSEQELWVEKLHATDHGSKVVVTGVWFFGTRADAGGAQSGRFTIVYRQEEGTSKIAHMHFANH